MEPDFMHAEQKAIFRKMYIIILLIATYLFFPENF